MSITTESAKAPAYEILSQLKKTFQSFALGWDAFLARWSPNNAPQSFTFQCAYCGDQSSSALSDITIVDSGVQLKCESCERPTIVGLFTVVEYGRACNVLAGKR